MLQKISTAALTIMLSLAAVLGGAGMADARSCGDGCHPDNGKKVGPNDGKGNNC